MIQTKATILQKESIAPAWWQLTISSPELSAKLSPGQFLMLRCGGYHNGYLRRAIFPQPLNNGKLNLLLRPNPDPGLAWLAARQAGDTLDVIGPLGRGFNLLPNVSNLLLVSNGQNISPLLGLMKQALTKGLSITMALGANRATTLYPVALLPPAIEFHAATLDGSLGHHGPISSLLPKLLGWADMVGAIGSSQLYQDLKLQTRRIQFSPHSNFLFGLISNTIFACGTGACFGCVLTTEVGVKQICTDGPVFDLTKIDLER